MTEPQVSNLNLPNLLTTLRIVMVPFFGWALLHDGGDSILWRTVAFVLFVGAMITDKIDGDIARKRNLVTNFGKIADPIADKAITGMAFIGLSIVGDIWWWVTIVVLLREWSVTLLRLSILKQVVVAAAKNVMRVECFLMVEACDLEACAVDRHQSGDEGDFHAVIVQFTSARLNKPAVVEQKNRFSLNILPEVGKQV
jgi:CDP-diacylglycerol--glycerol-3-phosphate 3-phosphatidyltransferase